MDPSWYSPAAVAVVLCVGVPRLLGIDSRTILANIGKQLRTVWSERRELVSLLRDPELSTFEAATLALYDVLLLLVGGDGPEEAAMLRRLLQVARVVGARADRSRILRSTWHRIMWTLASRPVVGTSLSVALGLEAMAITALLNAGRTVESVGHVAAFGIELACLVIVRIRAPRFLRFVFAALAGCLAVAITTRTGWVAGNALAHIVASTGQLIACVASLVLAVRPRVPRRGRAACAAGVLAGAWLTALGSLLELGSFSGPLGAADIAAAVAGSCAWVCAGWGFAGAITRPPRQLSGVGAGPLTPA